MPGAKWSPLQCRIRRQVADRLALWQGNGFQVLWVTLTSSPDSPEGRLRADWQVLRKRVARELGYGGFEYVCVETREGLGVLHMLWAWRDPRRGRRGSFYVPHGWLQEQWSGIHGAFHVNVQRVGRSGGDRRRLSAYLVTQYCAGQDALVRVSQSRLAVSLVQLRRALFAAVYGCVERYELGGRLGSVRDPLVVGRLMNQWLFSELRQAWASLLRSSWCEAFGVRWVWFAGSLERL